MAEAAVPEVPIDGQERRLLERAQDLGDSVIEEQFAGPQILEALHLELFPERYGYLALRELLVEEEQVCTLGAIFQCSAGSTPAKPSAPPLLLPRESDKASPPGLS